MINPAITNLVPIIQEFMHAQPVKRAWLFGSCSRGEETPASDIDILVTYDDEASMSLMGVSRLICHLSALLGRKVDLVEEGRVRKHALSSVDKDKILIYERKNTQ